MDLGGVAQFAMIMTSLFVSSVATWARQGTALNAWNTLIATIA